ncbi:NACHT domain-containing protein [Nodosilinea nodulosa]|uniref:NACHT domain-containing protein n=1 Tax=Nodosilinea nodulosa TaxID=416001 RepID=UPI0002F12889|nr:NACHT domain-containing protein [Nodosilinea nodulosa]
MASNENPRYLKLKANYCNEFLEAAKKEFPEGHYAGLSNAIKRSCQVSISKATLARILSGNRGEHAKVEAICDYYDKLLLDACESYEGQLSAESSDIDQLVDSVRKQVRFSFENINPASDRDQSSWVRDNFVELDMVEVEKLPSEYPALNREVLQNSQQDFEDEFDRIGLRLLRGNRTTGTALLEKHQRVSVYGEPGSGKSSYLQSIALRCRAGEALSSYVPIFIEIRHYSASVGVATIRTFIDEILAAWGANALQAEDILSAGRALFLFDGLDEAPEAQRSSIQFMIQEILSDYVDCKFICTSRLGAVFHLRGVQKVVISPFYSKKQIPEFITRWFDYYGTEPSSSNSMLEKLYSPRYKGIREIARRPVLLNLLCLTYDHNGDFPDQRIGVFASGLSALARRLQPDEGSTIVSAPYFREQDIKNILARIASYFFVHLNEQILFDVRDIERIIQDYCKEVHSINPDKVDSHVIIRGIEQFNGLLVRWGEMYCSFSHLTYQEYFTAEHLVRTDAYTDVYRYLADRRWSFVIELVSELVPRQVAWDFFVGFKVSVDNYVNGDMRLVAFLSKLDRAATFVAYTDHSDRSHVQVLIRAWYFAFALEDIEGITSFNTHSRRFDLPDLHFATSMVDAAILRGHRELYRAYHCCSEPDQPLKLKRCFQKLQDFFRDDGQRQDIIAGWLHLIEEQRIRYDNQADWWEAKRYRWQEKIANLLNTLGLPYIYGLNSEQVKRLRTYYRITRLLSTCINCSNLPDDRFAEIADSMLRLTSLPPSPRPDLPDFA